MPCICVEHRNLIEQEDLELHQCRNFRMIQFGKVKLRLQLGIQLKKRVQRRCNDVRPFNLPVGHR